MLAIFWVNYTAWQPDLFWQKETKKETYRDSEKDGETEYVYWKGKGTYFKPAAIAKRNLLPQHILGSSTHQTSPRHSLGSAGPQVNRSAGAQVLMQYTSHSDVWLRWEGAWELHRPSAKRTSDFLLLPKAASRCSFVFSHLTSSEGLTSLSFAKTMLGKHKVLLKIRAFFRQTEEGLQRYCTLKACSLLIV